MYCGLSLDYCKRRASSQLAFVVPSLPISRDLNDHVISLFSLFSFYCDVYFIRIQSTFTLIISASITFTFNLLQLQMGVQDVAFMPPGACFYNTFLRRCGRGYGLVTAKCHETVVGAIKGMLPVECAPTNPLFVLVYSFGGRKLSQHWGNLATPTLWG